jgi:hypothetical protein
MKLALLLALTLHVSKGGTMYVKGEKVELLSHARNGKVLAKLNAGTEVIWLGADEANPSWHYVDAGGKRGFVPMSALTPNKTITEEEAGKPPETPPGTQKPPSPPPYAQDRAYLKLLELTEATQAQRANVPAHVKAAGLKAGQ